jgi:hypothetical protein
MGKDDNVMFDNRIMLIIVIMYYILWYIALYFPHQFTDVVPEDVS